MKKSLIIFLVFCSGFNGLCAQTTTTDTIVKKLEEKFEIVDVQPEFPGGVVALYSFIDSNLKYPDDAKDVRGKVYVAFVIDKDGSVTDVEVKRGIMPSMDAEAVRVVSMMPKWKPGMQDGKPVRTKYTMPVAFRAY